MSVAYEHAPWRIVYGSNSGAEAFALSELLGLDYEVVQVLYAAYAAEHNEYGQILGGIAEYKVPLFDMFIYLKDQLDTHNISLGGQDGAMIDDLFDQLSTAQQQMQNEKYSRVLSQNGKLVFVNVS